MHNQPSVVLIDDNEEKLNELQRALEIKLSEDDVGIKAWKPTNGEDPFDRFNELVDSDTVLVVTDYDLTKAGLTGLFGVSIVSWCQARFIPAGDFSRGNLGSLPSEPNLFELRVPTEIEEAARYTTAMFHGFKDLRDTLEEGSVNIASLRSPAEVLAAVVDRPALENQLALYMSLLGAANASLLDSLRRTFSQNEQISEADKVRLLSYVIGHVLANAVMRYPGPILSETALCAYLATQDEEGEALRGIFYSKARYDGPFSSGAHYYWRDGVDGVIAQHVASIGDAVFETFGEFNRAVAEVILERPLANHGCRRCSGTKGGYWCPFTKRPVCERPDCSVASNSWIPPGADVTRVERDFYEEWAPLLGL